MNRLPPDHDPSDDADEHYRRASALDPSRPSEAVRRSVLDHAARLASQRAVISAPLAAASPRPAPKRRPRRAVIFGALAAAALAGLMIVPLWRSPPEVRPAVETHLLHASPPPQADLSIAAPPPAAAPAPASAPEPFPDAAVVHSYTSRGRSASKAAGEAAEPQLAKSAEPGSVMGALSAKASAEQAAPAARDAIGAAARAGTPAVQGLVAEDPAVSFRRAAQTGDLAALQTLLGKQTDINARDSLGRTALMLATLNGQTNAAAALLAYGADPNAADALGTTPFQAARAGNQAAIATALQRYGGR